MVDLLKSGSRCLWPAERVASVGCHQVDLSRLCMQEELVEGFSSLRPTKIAILREEHMDAGSWDSAFGGFVAA